MIPSVSSVTNGMSKFSANKSIAPTTISKIPVPIPMSIPLKARTGLLRIRIGRERGGAREASPSSMRRRNRVGDRAQLALFAALALFLAGAFLAGAFLAGVFLPGVFFADGFLSDALCAA